MEEEVPDMTTTHRQNHLRFPWLPCCHGIQILLVLYIYIIQFNGQVYKQNKFCDFGLCILIKLDSKKKKNGHISIDSSIHRSYQANNHRIAFSRKEDLANLNFVTAESLAERGDVTIARQTAVLSTFFHVPKLL